MGRSRYRRVRLCRCTGQRVDLSRAGAAGMEHALHAAAIHAHCRHSRTTVRRGCGARRRPMARDDGGIDGRRAGDGIRAALLQIHRVRQHRAQRHRASALDRAGAPSPAARTLAGGWCRGAAAHGGGVAVRVTGTARTQWLAAHRHGRRPRAVDRCRTPRTLSVLRQRCSQTHGHALHRISTRGLMTLKEMLGLDTRADRYNYEVDPVIGYVSAQKIPDRWVATTCGYCSVGCGMFIGVKDGRAVSVSGNPDHPVNRGMLCPKGLSEHHTIAADNRACYPLLRRGGSRERVSWADAIATMAARFRDVQARYGPGAVGVISTGQLVTEEFYALGKLVQLGLGTSNYDGNTTLCMATAVQGYKRSFGSDGPPGSYEDLEKADVVILIGANIAENHPLLCWRLRSNPATTLIVVDPRATKTAMMADLHLPLSPRSDLALVN